MIEVRFCFDSSPNPAAEVALRLGMVEANNIAATTSTDTDNGAMDWEWHTHLSLSKRTILDTRYSTFALVQLHDLSYADNSVLDDVIFSSETGNMRDWRVSDNTRVHIWRDVLIGPT